MERIDKLFSSCDILTRSQFKDAVRKKKITLNGAVVTSPSIKVDQRKDEICFNGKAVAFEKFVYIMLNKPQGVVSASSSSEDVTVVDILPQDMKRRGLFPCGRLDKDTLGLVIITNDGETSHRKLSPKSKTEKEYEFKTAQDVLEEDILQIEKGVTLKDGYTTQPAKVKLTSKTSGIITLTEGKYHEIKRIFASLHNKIIFLKRISFSKIKLDCNLKLGEARYLTDAEIELFKE